MYNIYIYIYIYMYYMYIIHIYIYICIIYIYMYVIGWKLNSLPPFIWMLSFCISNLSLKMLLLYDLNESHLYPGCPLWRLKFKFKTFEGFASQPYRPAPFSGLAFIWIQAPAVAVASRIQILASWCSVELKFDCQTFCRWLSSWQIALPKAGSESTTFHHTFAYIHNFTFWH